MPAQQWSAKLEGDVAGGDPAVDEQYSASGERRLTRCREPGLVGDGCGCAQTAYRIQRAPLVKQRRPRGDERRPGFGDNRARTDRVDAYAILAIHRGLGACEADDGCLCRAVDVLLA